MKLLTTLAFTLAALSMTTAAHAQSQGTDHAAHHAAPAGSAPGAMQEAIDGEVRKVDADAKKLTLRHGPIAAFDMPGMTMVFQVQDAKLLDGLKTGDKVKFKVDKINGQFTVTELKPAQ